MIVFLRQENSVLGQKLPLALQNLIAEVLRHATFGPAKIQGQSSALGGSCAF
jgi:hypothetical protein